ncbi:adenine phosphoribosyltransferase [Pseudodesulfovibrio sp. zrk46]|uniref:adenine phosphoribosyltransferase n=1 Tax=Pseudodesulfovibrio sp. zrk46 TaxID=2725288 RepID=UPI001448F83B|nr:adenine phosphoribosyltransferase [Pseudodesulfovibrio sp. zrk46]QJB57674.1 adenine phosphoribosyltransferase [Pseudodesulfovibrio sp. zrk46]
MNLREYVRDIPNYPKEGIMFFDITPILKSPKALKYAVDALAEKFQNSGATKIVAAEARGFLFGTPLACKMDIGFIPVRKPGKLPFKNCSVTYDLEYGTDTLCMHEDALEKDDKVLIIDDLLATGGTAAGMVQLVKNTGAEIIGSGFVVELGFLNGGQVMRDAGAEPISLLTID